MTPSVQHEVQQACDVQIESRPHAGSLLTMIVCCCAHMPAKKWSLHHGTLHDLFRAQASDDNQLIICLCLKKSRPLHLA